MLEAMALMLWQTIEIGALHPLVCNGWENTVNFRDCSINKAFFGKGLFFACILLSFLRFFGYIVCHQMGNTPHLPTPLHYEDV